MRKVIAGFTFFVVYIAGITLAWSIPGFSNGWTVIFSLVWFFIVSKLISYSAAKFGWTEPKESKKSKQGKCH